MKPRSPTIRFFHKSAWRFFRAKQEASPKISYLMLPSSRQLTRTAPPLASLRASCYASLKSCVPGCAVLSELRLENYAVIDLSLIHI